MRIVMWGSGAIGAYVGGCLARAGHSVTFVTRPATAAYLRENGLQLQLENETVRVGPLPAFDSIAAALASGPADLLIFALKAYDTADAVAQLRAASAAPPPVLCLQNGVDNEAALAQAVAPAQILAGTVTTAVSRNGPGEIVVERKRGLGLALTHPLSQPLLAALQTAGLNARGFASAPAMKWSKLLTNLIGNASSALLDWPVAQILADPRLFRLEIHMLREAVAVMHALGYPVVDLPGVTVRALAWGVRLPVPLTRPWLGRILSAGRGGKRPSFHIDLHGARRQTEVRWLNGAVARYGAAQGVATPINARLTEAVEALSASEGPPIAYQHRPEALLRLING